MNILQKMRCATSAKKTELLRGGKQSLHCALLPELSYEQAIVLFITEDLVLYDRCENTHLHGELQEALLGIEPLLMKASLQEDAAVEECFCAGVTCALKRAGNYCRSCERRISTAAHDELLPLVMQR